MMAGQEDRRGVSGGASNGDDRSHPPLAGGRERPRDRTSERRGAEQRGQVPAPGEGGGARARRAAAGRRGRAPTGRTVAARTTARERGCARTVGSEGTTGA